LEYNYFEQLKASYLTKEFTMWDARIHKRVYKTPPPAHNS